MILLIGDSQSKNRIQSLKMISYHRYNQFYLLGYGNALTNSRLTSFFSQSIYLIHEFQSDLLSFLQKENNEKLTNRYD